MIENFRLITAKENLIRPNITPNVGDSLFEFASDEEYKEYINNAPQGLRWEFLGKEIKFFEKPISLFGLPTPNLQRVVVVYPYDHQTYTSPNNAVIYNNDGSFYIQLKCPQLISDLAKKSRLIPFGLYFERVAWSKDSKGDIITSISIGYNRDWWESRVLNPETGEFGELLSSGLR